MAVMELQKIIMDLIWLGMDSQTISELIRYEVVTLFTARED